MLCCGLLAVIAAALAGSWRRLGAARWIVPAAAALLAIPAVASVAGERSVPPSRADIAARAMQMLCGEPAK
ncbi:hypothetical protein KRR38_27400 [Novosphingobium sp. G106]|uniref:hypothetical protein n=1 Tax=Novosphingobium sp. G106 TaxID=2849500 RepID=UPI001C2CFCB6|nr:hypothetical protein [Novosphingobium sp. G106]MBV1691310.1 hypothetical protein [Novosphingobium sp. G106]